MKKPPKIFGGLSVFSYLCYAKYPTNFILMSENIYSKKPAVVWLRVTDFMRAWAARELGGEQKARGIPVLSVLHLNGVKEAMRLGAYNDMRGAQALQARRGDAITAMSAAKMTCIETGLRLDCAITERLYGLRQDDLEAFMPVECPAMCVNDEGTLRPWTKFITMGQKQAAAIQVVIREAFWRAVADYDRQYAEQHQSEQYYASDMLEAFCTNTGTPTIYADGMRREWQRRKRFT